MNNFYQSSCKFLLILSIALGLAACGGVKPYKMPISQGVVITEEMAAQLQEGLHKQQVRALLGPDYAKNIFDDRHWNYLYQSTNQKIHQDAISRISLQFDQDGYLTNWKIGE